MTATDSSGQQVEVFAVPKWFLYLLSGLSTVFLALFVPWSAWVTGALLTLTVKMDTNEKVEARVQLIESKFQEHIADPNIHHAAHREASRRIDSLEHRLNLLEQKKP